RRGVRADGGRRVGRGRRGGGLAVAALPTRAVVERAAARRVARPLVGSAGEDLPSVSAGRSPHAPGARGVGERQRRPAAADRAGIRPVPPGDARGGQDRAGVPTRRASRTVPRLGGVEDRLE
ncbi:MAG: hypothetical protein ACK55I_15510, partial [bacterium]